jgi:hypothetical protein
MDISKCAAQFCYPEPDSLICEGLSRYVKPKVATIHEIHHKISDGVSD